MTHGTPITICPPSHRHAEVGTCHTLHACRCDPCIAAQTIRSSTWAYADRATACPRCGFVRDARKNVLCVDCVYVMSKEEKALWVA
jgi:hypothetical protein